VAVVVEPISVTLGTEVVAAAPHMAVVLALEHQAMGVVPIQATLLAVVVVWGLWVEMPYLVLVEMVELELRL